MYVDKNGKENERFRTKCSLFLGVEGAKEALSTEIAL